MINGKFIIQKECEMISKNIELIKRTAIVALASDDKLLQMLVLKGGNAIVYGHELDSRGSKDIDYSMEGEFSDEYGEIEQRIKKALTETFDLEGFVVDSFEMVEKPKILKNELQDFWGGYKVVITVIEKSKYDPEESKQKRRMKSEVILKNNSPKFTIEISKHEYCQEEKVAKTIDDYTVYVYSEQLIIAEKLRALCQQMPKYKQVIGTNTSKPRPRDFHDIFYLIENPSNDIIVNAKEFKELLVNVFNAKRVPLEWIYDIAEQYEFHRAEEHSLYATISGEKKTFKEYFDYVINEVVNRIELNQ